MDARVTLNRILSEIKNRIFFRVYDGRRKKKTHMAIDYSQTADASPAITENFTSAWPMREVENVYIDVALWFTNMWGAI